MNRSATFTLFFGAVFLQAGAYGLTFLLPDLFATFGANEKTVGQMLAITAVATIITVYYSGHLSDKLGRLRTLAMGCFSIAAALFLFSRANGVDVSLVAASLLLGSGWGITYALAPVALTRLVGPLERVRFFALLSIFVMAGFGLSPVMAASLQAQGFTVADAFGTTAIFCVFSGVLFLILVQPMRNHALIKGVEPRSTLTLASIETILASPAILPVMMVMLGASVFAGLNNFQTVFARARGLDYSIYFLTYTITVVVFRILLARFKGGSRPYLTIATLQYTMCASVVLFMLIGGNHTGYIAVAILFGIGYGASYPILVAMAANDANTDLVPQTLQLFALSYFIGIFGFPLIAGWMIVEIGTMALLALVATLAITEASLALRRGIRTR